MMKHRASAIQKNGPGVQVSAQEARRRAELDRISWDNMRLLLVLAESGSFRSAATVAGLSLNTIRGKIERLERQIGGPLLRRSVEGVTLTQDGLELVSIARQMRALGKTAERVQANAQGLRDKTVRITVTEGLGTFWLVPHLVDFRKLESKTSARICSATWCRLTCCSAMSILPSSSIGRPTPT